jgi:hypothetical protein
MASVSSGRPRVKPARKLGWVFRHPEHGYGVLRVAETVGRKVVVDDYFVLPIPADFGVAFEVTKLVPGKGADTRYAVNLGGEGEPATCECKGFLEWGHCRHVSGLQALRAAGRLGAAPAPAAAPAAACA